MLYSRYKQVSRLDFILLARLPASAVTSKRFRPSYGYWDSSGLTPDSCDACFSAGAAHRCADIPAIHLSVSLYGGMHRMSIIILHSCSQGFLTAAELYYSEPGRRENPAKGAFGGGGLPFQRHDIEGRHGSGSQSVISTAAARKQLRLRRPRSANPRRAPWGSLRYSRSRRWWCRPVRRPRCRG